MVDAVTQRDKEFFGLRRRRNFRVRRASAGSAPLGRPELPWQLLIAGTLELFDLAY
jgi:hypothetical protein